MKTYVKLALPGFTGNMDDMVIYYNSALNCLIARKKVIPKFTPNNRDVQLIFSMARRLVLSSGFKDDIRTYIRLFNRKYRRKNRGYTAWPAVWMKMMKNMLKLYPDLNLEELTRDDIIDRNLPCKSIASAVQAGCLDQVPGSALLTNSV